MQIKYEPSFNITRQQRLDYCKLANGYCIECEKPIKKNYYICPRCSIALAGSGLTRRVYFKKVSDITINYIQHLHRTFFGCNAPYKYRGLKENRIRNNIKQETINELCKKLHIELQNTKLGKLPEFYNQVKDTPNILRRLLYNMVLYGIAYYIYNDKSFDNEAVYQASQVRMLDNQIKRTYIRLNQNEEGDYKYLRYDTYNRLSRQRLILKIIEPKVAILLSELVSK